MANTNYHKANTNYQRANKNRPREISSKKPVSVLRDVFSVKKKQRRDPRFDDLSGTLNEDIFEKNYSFINDIKKQEKEALEKELRKVVDQERKQEILRSLQRMKDQEKAKKRSDKRKQEEQNVRKEMMEAAKMGKKPYIPKQSEVKQKNMIQFYQSLKESGRLEKYLEKKRKKQFAKDRMRFYKE